MARRVTSLTKTLVQSGDEVTLVKADDVVVVMYDGWLYKADAPNERGRRIYTSDPNQPYRFVVGAQSMIQGWERAILQMSLGEKAVWVIPSDLAYGSNGLAGLIPPNADLIFEIEVRSINGQLA